MSASSSKVIAATGSDPRWAAVKSRDVRADGRFFYAVRTTGIYCRPSCASRRPRPENVAFYPTREAAEEAGFRACRRCRPDRPSVHEQHAETVTEICRLIEASDTVPGLRELAEHAGMSPYYFHRIFKSITGLTPKEYADGCRHERVRDNLGSGGSITGAIFDAGYNASSRFYEQAGRILGMTPTDYRDGGNNRQIYFAVGECSLGSILVAGTDRGICAISLGDDPDTLARDLQDRFPKSDLVGGDGDFEQLVAEVVAFVESPATGLDLPLDIRGTAFQQRVWQALREIPAGETASYSDIARRIGKPGSARAVARACAANKLAVVIPCHRVVRNDGVLSGYRWGVERKRVLLEREAESEPLPG